MFPLTVRALYNFFNLDYLVVTNFKTFYKSPVCKSLVKLLVFYYYVLYYKLQRTFLAVLHSFFDASNPLIFLEIAIFLVAN